MNRSVRTLGLAIVLFSGVVSTVEVEAKQYEKVVGGREVVVHTNPVPVLMHRLVPPQLGRHITEKELHRGTIPAEGRLFKSRGK
jgi:hypothetical protein